MPLSKWHKHLEQRHSKALKAATRATEASKKATEKARVARLAKEDAAKYGGSGRRVARYQKQVQQRSLEADAAEEKAVRKGNAARVLLAATAEDVAKALRVSANDENRRAEVSANVVVEIEEVIQNLKRGTLPSSRRPQGLFSPRATWLTKSNRQWLQHLAKARETADAVKRTAAKATEKAEAAESYAFSTKLSVESDKQKHKSERVVSWLGNLREVEGKRQSPHQMQAPPLPRSAPRIEQGRPSQTPLNHRSNPNRQHVSWNVGPPTADSGFSRASSFNRSQASSVSQESHIPVDREALRERPHDKNADTVARWPFDTIHAPRGESNALFESTQSSAGHKHSNDSLRGSISSASTESGLGPEPYLRDGNSPGQPATFAQATNDSSQSLSRRGSSAQYSDASRFPAQQSRHIVEDSDMAQRARGQLMSTGSGRMGSFDTSLRNAQRDGDVYFPKWNYKAWVDKATAKENSEILYAWDGTSRLQFHTGVASGPFPGEGNARASHSRTSLAPTASSLKSSSTYTDFAGPQPIHQIEGKPVHYSSPHSAFSSGVGSMIDGSQPPSRPTSQSKQIKGKRRL